ncbi:hypothetical protein Tco_0472269 [Tanacetum coccineum]
MMVLEKGLLNYEGDSVLMGCVKEFKYLPNLSNVCCIEGFPSVKITYLGGFWVLMEFDSIESCEKFQKHNGVILEGKLVVVRAKEVTGWVPEFRLDDNLQQKDDKKDDRDNNLFDIESSHDDDVGEEVLDSFQNNNIDKNSKKESNIHEDWLTGNPFGLEQ